jgi:4-hydroxybenzoate polyprenyltransferase
MPTPSSHAEQPTRTQAAAPDPNPGTDAAVVATDQNIQQNIQQDVHQGFHHDMGTVGHRLAALARDIKLAHTVFALPFAILGGAMVAQGQTAGTLAIAFILILICMVAARTWAMVFNRYVDRGIDAANPRTARRALAAGRVTPADARLVLAGSALVFIGACALFWVIQSNTWPLVWSVPVLGWIAMYSLTKRFTALCHLVLGVSLALAPIAAAVALAPELVLSTPALFFTAGYVALWVAGFDVIYGLQDLDYDRDNQLNSIPARLGWRGAIWVSRLLHILAQGLLIAAALAHDELGVIFGTAVGIAGALLIFEHAVLARRGRAGLQMAFFTINGIISVLLGLAGVTDLII